MLALPDRTLDIEDTDRLADWVEASALLGSRVELRRSEVFDLLFDSGLLADLEEEGDEADAQERVEDRVEDIWRALDSRARRLGPGYPFAVRADGLARTVGTWRDARCFTLPLLSDLGRFYTTVKVAFSPGTKFALLFEKVVEVCTKKLFRGATVRFGWPCDAGWPVGIKARVRELAKRVDRDPETLKGKIHSKDKDLGLDVVSKLALGDDGDATLVLLVQCATGKNWKGKHEPSLDEWKALIRWRGPVVRAIAFPWRMQVEPMAWRDLLRLDGVALDRLRLVSSGNPDSLLETSVTKEIDAWCSQRASEFPRD